MLYLQALMGAAGVFMFLLAVGLLIGVPAITVMLLRRNFTGEHFAALGLPYKVLYFLFAVGASVIIVGVVFIFLLFVADALLKNSST
jgi:hypothetical protein